MSKSSDYLYQVFSLDSKTAIVTGAGGGIGAALATGLARAGATVALCDINLDALDVVRKEISDLGGKALVMKMDMRDTSKFNEIVREICEKSNGFSESGGGIDILVNCAGINKREGIYDVAEETFDNIMNINLKGAFFLSQAVAPYMKAGKNGAIINVGSHNTGPVLGGVSVYAASKSGLLALTRSMAVEWAKYNIRANCISPGHIQTPLTAPTWQNPERSKYLLERIALGRPGTPDDIVGLCIFLASDAAAYITGCEYRVDGGCVCGGQPWPYDTEF
ncbi:MAG: glucose 1-dehydrogenase [Defluviitaleaceae bacterium]|nr:glucose 1-dehydrogenase [Defluviitaleaceae bacterium]